MNFEGISGNINYVNVDNLFYKDNYWVKLSYTNYCLITEDFTTKQLDSEAIWTVVNFGFSHDYVV